MRSKLLGVLLVLAPGSMTEALQPIVYYDLDDIGIYGQIDSVSGNMSTFNVKSDTTGVISRGKVFAQYQHLYQGPFKSINFWAFPTFSEFTLSSNVNKWRDHIGFYLGRPYSGGVWGSPTNNWTMFTGVNRGNYVEYWVNGKIHSIVNPFEFNEIYREANYEGRFDEISLYEYELTQEEIIFLYNNGQAERPSTVYQGVTRPISFYINGEIIQEFQTSTQFKNYFIEYAFPPGVSWETVVVNFDNFSLGGTDEFGTVSDVPIEFQNFVLVVLGIFAGFTLAKILTDNLFPK